MLRVYEPAGARGATRLALPEGWSAETVDLLERPVALGEDMRPFEVRSWRLTRG